MSAAEVLHHLRTDMDLTVAADHGRLLVSPAERITDEARALIRQHKADLLALLEPANDSPTDLDALAEGIAAEFRVPAAAVLGLLDDDDREAIRTGSDPGRANAWRAAVASLVQRGAWLPLPGNDPAALVTCETCTHARPAAPGLIDCATEVRAPGACGPFRRWAADLHHCEQWEAQP